MVDPQSLRRIANKLLAMALNDSNPHFVRALVARAMEHLDRASDLEASGVPHQEPGSDAQESK